MYRFRFVAGAAVLATVVAACGPNPSPLPALSIYLPVVRPDPDPRITIMTARFSGWLSVQDGCIWARTTDRDLVVWVSPMRLVVRDGRIGVVNTNGDAVFDGDEIQGAGGAIDGGMAAAIRVENMVGQPVPPACRTQEYWLGAMTNASPSP